MGGGSDVAIETAAITLMRHIFRRGRCAGDFEGDLTQYEAEPAGRVCLQLAGIPIAAGILWPLTGTCSTRWSPARGAVVDHRGE
jgi:hypothetical protein